MGLAKALRRVCSSQSSSTRQSKQNKQPNRSHTFAKSSTSSSRPFIRLRRRPRRSTPNALPSNQYQTQEPSFAPTPHQQKQQEVAVISDYRDRLENFANAAKHIHRVLDIEPGDSNAIIHLHSLRAHLHKALESYFAAAGTRSTEGLRSILPTIERTDVRLAAIEQEILTEVSRFDDAACTLSTRFDVAESSQNRINVIADADHTLIELEIYRSAWGPIMDSSTASRLENASKQLRKVVASSDEFYDTNDYAQFDNYPNSSITQSLPNGYLPNGHSRRTKHNSNLAKLPNGFYSSQHVASHSGTSNASRSDERAFLHSKYPPPPQLPDFSYPYQNSIQNTNRHPNFTPIPSHSSRDTDSSESGDEGPRKMVMSRTRTLRDMAETAMSVEKDDNIEPYEPINHIHNDKPTYPSMLPSSSKTPYYRTEQLQSDSSRRESSDAESQPPKLNDTKNASFATAFFKTTKVRAESISDVGILLRRSNVRGDGRCLFRALARGRTVATGRPIPSERIEREEADTLRQRAVAELKKHRKLLARSFVIEGDFTTYTKKMAHPKTYGGEPELLMLAKVLHVPIAVYIAKNGVYRRIQVYGKMYCGDPLRILYSDGIHYDALLAMQ